MDRVLIRCSVDGLRLGFSTLVSLVFYEGTGMELVIIICWGWSDWSSVDTLVPWTRY